MFMAKTILNNLSIVKMHRKLNGDDNGRWTIKTSTWN